MKALRNGMDKVLGWAAVALFVALVLVVVLQVLNRQVFTPLGLKVAMPWTEEAARYIFVWLGFFATALVFSERGHIAVDFVVRKLPILAQKGVAIFVQLCIMAFAALILVVGGWNAAMSAMNQQLSTLPFLYGQMYLVMPIAGLIILLYSITHVVGIINGTEPLTPGGDEVEAELERVAADETIGSLTAENAPESKEK